MNFSDLVVVHSGLAAAAIPRATKAKEHFENHDAKGAPGLRALRDFAAFIEVHAHGETSYWRVDGPYRITALQDTPQKRGVFFLRVSDWDGDNDQPMICDP